MRGPSIGAERAASVADRLVQRDPHDVLRVSVEQTDASGEVRLVAHEGGPALVDRLGPGRAANAERRRRDTWAVDPRCVTCDAVVPAWEPSGLVETPDGPRIDCGGPCHIAAIRRYLLRPLIPMATRAGAR